MAHVQGYMTYHDTTCGVVGMPPCVKGQATESLVARTLQQADEVKDLFAVHVDAKRLI